MGTCRVAVMAEPRVLLAHTHAWAGCGSVTPTGRNEEARIEERRWLVSRMVQLWGGERLHGEVEDG